MTNYELRLAYGLTIGIYTMMLVLLTGLCVLFGIGGYLVGKNSIVLGLLSFMMFEIPCVWMTYDRMIDELIDLHERA